MAINFLKAWTQLRAKKFSFQLPKWSKHLTVTGRLSWGVRGGLIRSFVPDSNGKDT